MKTKLPYPARLAGKIIDIHSHVGTSLKACVRQEYPYAGTVEGIYYRQLSGGVDVNVVFPYTADLHFEPGRLAEGVNVPAKDPLSPVPYGTENELLLREVYDFCPELSDRFLPFVSVDPERSVDGQLKLLERLAAQYTIYGIKINPPLCQARITGLLEQGRSFLDLARDKGWPFLLHTTAQAEEEYSNAEMTFHVIEKNPDIRFCLAHCIGFHRDYLALADECPNVWIDTAALAIQVQAAHENHPIIAPPSERFPGDYSDPNAIMLALAKKFPATLIWGSDTPCYAYISRRKQAGEEPVEFRLKARYEDEVGALRALPEDLQLLVANENSLRFLFGAGDD